MLVAVKLSETNEVPGKVQLLKVGEFYQENGKKVKITKEILAFFVRNFTDKVRGYSDGKLPIDYFHENEKIAAGWIEGLSVEDGGQELWGDIKWTPAGGKKLSDGELRYISVEFHFDYQHNESEKKFGPTLFGAGLTNRPFIKGMESITTFSEEKNKMTIEEAMKKIDALNAKIAELEKSGGANEIEMNDLKKKLGEQDASYKAEKKLAEQRDSFNKMMAEGKAVEAQREAFVAGDMVKFAELAKTTNFGGKGNGGAGDEDADKNLSAQDKVLKLAEKEVSDNKISFSEGIKKVLLENKELSDAYHKEVAIK